METLQIYGVEFLVTLQSITLPALEWPMRLVTFFGEEMFYMIAGTFIYWCLSRELGFRLLIVLLLTNMVNLMGTARALTGSIRTCAASWVKLATARPRAIPRCR